jgi:tRNA threonylcarbamoyladenosine biosynthesis protein TsaB
MNILAIDTCLDACSVAVCADGRVLAAASEPMPRGHQERLAPLAEAMMAAAHLAFKDLGRVAVTVGPGSFTGLRVGLAFAKGLALALDIPCVGIGTLEALAETAGGGGGLVGAVIDAHRGQVYLQIFIDGRPVMAPDVLPVETAAARLAELWPGGPATLTGSGATLLAAVLPDARIEHDRLPDPVAVARLAARVRFPAAPRPLYLRAPDAKLPGRRPLGG